VVLGLVDLVCDIERSRPCAVYYVDAEAGRAKTRNAGIPIFFVIVWFMCALFGPAVGYIVSGMRSMFRNKADG
jgi:hypothetical protein